jgi:hypothetical protein
MTPIAFAAPTATGRLAVTCPACDQVSVIDYVGTRPLPECGHYADIRRPGRRSRMRSR